jgi:hypothetical protein
MLKIRESKSFVTRFDPGTESQLRGQTARGGVEIPPYGRYLSFVADPIAGAREQRRPMRANKAMHRNGGSCRV